jgi:hypothetical protein
MLVSTNIWENGDIELKWWPIKAWANFDFPDFPPNHHNMRWGITFPAVLFVRLFGEGAFVYLMVTHVVYALTTAFLYALTRMLTTPLVAALMLGLWLINPVAHDLPSNLMPEVYSMIYPAVALLLVRNAYATESRWSFAWAVVMMFFAYGAKETNIFFMPGWGLYELIRRKWLNVALIIGVFGACLLVETVAVNLLLSDSHLLLGRPQAILEAGHLDEMSTDWVYQPIDLLTRWWFNAQTNLERLEFFSKAIYWAFFAVTAWKAWIWIRARSLLPPAGAIGPTAAPGGEVISIAWAMGLSFAFCTTFFILSWDPLVLGQPLNDRYLYPLLIPAYIVLAVVLRFGVERVADARAGWMGALAALQRFAVPLVESRHLAVLFAIAAFCTLTRWGIELGTIVIRRDGFDQPYTTFTAQAYLDEARQHVLDGCTLVFPRVRPAQALLVHSFPYREIEPSLALYRLQMDGLIIDARRLRAWPLPPADYPAIADKLYGYSDVPGAFAPLALRLEGGACERAYYYGHGDINPRDQPIATPIHDPPPA